MRYLAHFICAALAATALAASPASAGIGPDSNQVAAIDGTDVYGYTEYTNRFNVPIKVVLHRRSISGGKTKRLATYDPHFTRVQGVDAGGGRVAVVLDTHSDLEYLRTKVVAMNRDGSGRSVLASAKIRQGFDNSMPRIDCGSSVRLAGATSSGSFIVSSVRSTRRGKICGRRPNVDHWKYVEVAAAGSRRMLYSANLKASGMWSLPPLAEISVNGDYAAFETRKSRRVFMKNLASGTQTGPFMDSVRLSGAKLSDNRLSLGPAGILAIESSVLDQADNDPPRWLDVFSDPLQPGIAARSDRLYDAQFCGSHLINLDHGDGVPGSPDENATIREFDPRTLVETRRIATIPGFASIASCSENYVVINTRQKLRAISLAP